MNDMKPRVTFYVHEDMKQAGVYEPKAPTKANPDDAGFDLYAPRDIYLQPGDVTVVDLGITVKMDYMPSASWFLALPRSSSGFKKGLFLLNTAGVIDQSFCGPDDRLMMLLGRRKMNPVYGGPTFLGSEANMVDKMREALEQLDGPWIKRGERFAQLILVKSAGELEIMVNNHKPLAKSSRGGLGSTGEK